MTVDDLKARLRGAADYPEIHGITKCNLQVMLWEAANALDAKNARIAELEQGYANACQREDNLKDDLKAAEAKCERLTEALTEARKDAAEHKQDSDAWLHAATVLQKQRNLFARALRWVFKNGMKPDHDRPEHVNKAFDEAWEGHRADNPWRWREGEPET